MIQKCIFKWGVNEDVALWERQHGKNKNHWESPSRRETKEWNCPKRALAACFLEGAWKALGYLPTYCGIGVGAEYGVFSDDAVELERGKPGHKDQGGWGRRCLHSRRRTWNWKSRAFSHSDGASDQALRPTLPNATPAPATPGPSRWPAPQGSVLWAQLCPLGIHMVKPQPPDAQKVTLLGEGVSV